MNKSPREFKLISSIKETSQQTPGNFLHHHTHQSSHDVQSVLNNSAGQFFVKGFSYQTSKKEIRGLKDDHSTHEKGHRISNLTHEINRSNWNSKSFVNEIKREKRERRENPRNERKVKEIKYKKGI